MTDKNVLNALEVLKETYEMSKAHAENVGNESVASPEDRLEVLRIKQQALATMASVAAAISYYELAITGLR